MKIILIALLVSTSLFAQTNTSSVNVSSNKSNSNKKSKFTLEMVLAGEQTKSTETNNVDGAVNKLDISLLQAFNKDDEFRYFVAGQYQTYNYKSSEDNDDFKWDLAEFMYRRKNILNEKAHGLQLNVEFKNYYLIDERTRDLYGFDGAFIPQLVFSKNITPRFNTEMKLRRHFYQQNNGKEVTLDHEDRVYLTPSYLVGQRVLLFSQFTYKHKIRKDESFSFRTMSVTPKEEEQVVFHPGIMYFASRKMMLEAYVETKLSNTLDDRDMNTISQNEQVFGAAAYFTAF